MRRFEHLVHCTKIQSLHSEIWSKSRETIEHFVTRIMTKKFALKTYGSIKKCRCSRSKSYNIMRENGQVQVIVLSSVITTIASPAGLDYDTNARYSPLHGREYFSHAPKCAIRLPITENNSNSSHVVYISHVRAERFPA